MLGAVIVADLSPCEARYQRLAVAVTDRVKLRVQPALGPSDAPRSMPFFAGLAAVRCAFRSVASIIAVSIAQLLATSSENVRLGTLACDQSVDRLQSVLCGP